MRVPFRRARSRGLLVRWAPSALPVRPDAQAELRRAERFVMEPLEARVLLAAHLDPTFGNAGQVWVGGRSTEAFALFSAYAQRITAMPDGSVILTSDAEKPYGEFPGQSYDVPAMRRLGTDGAPDDSFTPSGALYAYYYENKVMPRPGGAGGMFLLGWDGLNALTATGAQDETFAFLPAIVSAESGILFNDGAATPDGGIVLAGAFNNLHEPRFGQLFVTRNLPDGSPDLSFGDGGAVRITEGEVNQATVAIDSAGGVLVLYAPRDGGATLTRLTGDGRIDPSFGTNGSVSISHRFTAWDQGVVIQPDGRILVPVADKIYRFTADGRPDLTWGGDGHVVLPSRMGAWTVDEYQQLFVDGQGRVGALVESWGTALGRVTDGLGLFRLLPDGTPDVGLGARGFSPLIGSGDGWIADATFQTLPDGRERLLVLGMDNQLEGYPDAANQFHVSAFADDGLPFVDVAPSPAPADPADDPVPVGEDDGVPPVDDTDLPGAFTLTPSASARADGRGESPVTVFKDEDSPLDWRRDRAVWA